MLTQETNSSKQALLPTYPQHIIEALTPRQLRATLAGQQYYSHFHGTSATQEQLGTAIERRKQQWQRNHASLEWQLHFTRGWNSALLAEQKAATQEQPAVVLCDPEDTEDEVGSKPPDNGDVLARPIHGDPIAPAKAGEPTRAAFGADDAPVMARQSCCDEKDIEEDYRPRIFGGTATARMLCDPESAADEEEEGFLMTRSPIQKEKPAALSIASEDEEDDTVLTPLLFAPDDETEERRPSANHDEIEYRRTRRRVIPQPTRLTFIPEDPTTDRPLFATGGETQHYSFGDDDDEQEEHGGWLRSRLPHYLAAQKGDGAYLLATTSGYPLLFGDDDEKDDEWGRSPHAFLARKATFTAALLA